MKPIQIVTATNDNYAQHLGVMLNSLLSNSSDKRSIRISVIEAGLSRLNKRRLKKVVKRYGAEVKFYRVNPVLFQNFKETEYISKETYYRIVIPDLLSKKINKVIYLDCDLVVDKDISKLWRIDIDKHYLAAVKKPSMKNRNIALGIPKNASYFNAGVLLINLKKWREKRISGKVLNFIRRNPENIQFCSQDPLNAVLHNKWMKLDAKWNYTTSHWKQNVKAKPAIIHFTGRSKPWNEGHPLQHKYIQYLRTTKWEAGKPGSIPGARRGGI